MVIRLSRCFLFLTIILIDFEVYADETRGAIEDASLDNSEASGNSHKTFRDEHFNHCDLVFHCVITKELWISSEETKEYKEERFTFALKGGELLVPKKRTVLGDGTLDYDLTDGGCNKTDGKLLVPEFEARMFDDKWVEYKNGRLFGVDAQGDSVSSDTIVWYAECENFD